MNVLVEIGFKICQGLVQSLVADAGIAGRRISCAGLTHRAQSIARGVVFVHHHGHGILHAAERWRQNRFLLDDRLFHPHDVGEQDHFFLHHVRGEFLSESPKAGAHMLQFRMVLAVHRANLVKQRAQSGDLLPRVLVVRALDVGDHVG